MEQKTVIHFEDASLSNLEDLNASFATGRLKVMYTGENRNGMEISQETVSSALPSLKNIPIVAHYDVDENMIGSHDMEVVKDGDGLRLRNLTEPCGVVPESVNAYFQKERDDNGEEHNYLVIEPVILWKRQEVYRHIRDDMDGRVDHSMEISINAYHKNSDSKVISVDEFTFEALCLLEGAKPCFEGSSLELFDACGFKARMEEMMSELRETLFTVNASATELDINSNNEEGGMALDEKLALLEEFGIMPDTLDFSVDDFSVEELREKFEAMRADAQTDSSDAGDSAKFELTQNMHKVLCDALHERKIMKPWGVESLYCLEDYDPELAMVYARNFQDWNVYGFPFTMNGDDVSIDFDAGKRMKIAFVEFDEGDTLPGVMAQMFESIGEKFEALNSEKNELESKQAELAASFDELKESTADIDELRKFKADAEENELRAQREAIFEQFEDLAGNEAFEELRETADQYEIESLEERCFAIRGRISMPAKFSVKEKTPKLKVSREEKADEPYGGLFEKYGHAD